MDSQRVISHEDVNAKKKKTKPKEAKLLIFLTFIGPTITRLIVGHLLIYTDFWPFVGSIIIWSFIYMYLFLSFC